jgi:hypothetical protein
MEGGPRWSRLLRVLFTPFVLIGELDTFLRKEARAYSRRKDPKAYFTRRFRRCLARRLMERKVEKARRRRRKKR